MFFVIQVDSTGCEYVLIYRCCQRGRRAGKMCVVRVCDLADKKSTAPHLNPKAKEISKERWGATPPMKVIWIPQDPEGYLTLALLPMCSVLPTNFG